MYMALFPSFKAKSLVAQLAPLVSNGDIQELIEAL